jgi:hypothetical protein
MQSWSPVELSKPALLVSGMLIPMEAHRKVFHLELDLHPNVNFLAADRKVRFLVIERQSYHSFAFYVSLCVTHIASVSVSGK